MTVYNWNTSELLLPCAKVFAASGVRIRNVLRCDTESGLVVRSDEAGNTITQMWPAPLRVEFEDRIA